ncbi:hypothetical protein F2Q69_00047699 [Brassica cretica]|uniref:RNase H type-1 domain-containing protein n=1 Tax=Brassica cretica TaxID=69181 RepID=A0A8S9PXW8_BRACR|nr:hypothetical protein F2Q69_00047699 [Brassica cretica]
MTKLVTVEETITCGGGSRSKPQARAEDMRRIDANASGWIWAIESMCSLRKNKVIFAVEASDLLGAVIRRPAWPSFRWFSHRIIGSLNSVGHWKLELIARKANLSAFLIAKSVISENLPQSYVARSHTRWVVLVSVLLKYE